MNNSSKIFDIKLINVLLTLIFIFFFQSSLSRTLLPYWLNIVGVTTALVINLYFIFTRKKLFYFFLILSAFTILCMISLLKINEYPFDLQLFSFFIIILLAFTLRDEITKFIPWIKLFLILNLFALIYEKYSGSMIFFGNRDYVMDAYVYGQGLNTYAKGAAEMIAISLLLFRNNNLMKLIIFISSLFIGVRSAIVITVIIIFIDFILSTKITRKSFLYSLIFMIIFVYSGYWLIDNNIIYSGRYLSLFDLSTPTFESRWYIMGKHLETYQSLPIFQQLFGSGFYIGNLYSWGSESFPIQILTYYGLIFFLFYILLCVCLLIRILTSKKGIIDFYPYLLILLIGIGVRFPVGWFGGIIFFGLLYIIIFEKEKWINLRNVIGPNLR